MQKGKRKHICKTFKLAGQFTTQEIKPPKEYEISKETIQLIKNHGNAVDESRCKHAGRASHQVHRF